MKKTFILIFLVSFCLSGIAQNLYNVNICGSLYKNSNTILNEKSVKNSPADSLINLCISEINPDSIKRTIQQLQNFGTRYMLAPNHKNVALWLQNKYMSMGYTNIVLDSFITVTNLPNGPANDTSMQYNVIATFTGNVNSNNVYIVGGHYDDITYVDPMNNAPGADDDASGVAAAIEIARVMKKIGYNPDATIKFIAFAGEEAMLAYADEYGSHHYVSEAINNDENIIFFVTNDMIANNTDSTNWKVKINHHINSGLTVQLANEICQNYTALTPVDVLQSMNNGADDIPFAQAGIPSLYMAENNFSPNYHRESDTVGNCNMAYCAEVTKVSAGMLIWASESPLNTKNFFIINPGDGHTLEPSWEPNDDLDIAGYNVYLGKTAGVFDTVVFTTGTSFVFGNLLTDTTYYIGIAAIDINGNESIITEKSDAPGLVTFSQGVLIVKDSRGGFLNPSEQQVDDFYNMICSGFVHSQYDATETNKISLGVVGKYSSLLWHMNNMNWPSSVLSNYSDVLRNYLNLGGHILFTIYEPSEAFENNTDYPSYFHKGSFMFDCANVDSVGNSFYTMFSKALPASPDFTSLFVDSLKIIFLPNIEVLYPNQNSNILYLFYPAYNDTKSQANIVNKPVGIENNDADKNLVMLSFPLYYMKPEQSKDFVNHVMADKFNEHYIRIHETQSGDNSDIIIYPNPATNRIMIIYADNQSVNLSVYNIVGELVLQRELVNTENEIDISSLTTGIYILKVTGSDWTAQKKIIKE
jgi:hypothetical protein